MNRLILKILFIATMTGITRAAPLPIVAIQPLGPVKSAEVQKLKAGITAMYAVTVEILPEKPLPDEAYYKPRDRFKADNLVEILAEQEPASASKIIALTARDISTTKADGSDWGIMGMGQFGGRGCVISTFRLRTGKADDTLFFTRLVKVANHELGHTFGLDHCSNAGCLMQDVRGKIATIDAETGKTCAVCSSCLPLAK